MSKDSIIRFRDLSKKRSRDIHILDEEKSTEILQGIKVGEKVDHSHFGSGKIVGLTEDIVTVQFGTTERKFSYPGAFLEMYLNRRV